LFGGCNQCPAGQVIGFSKETARALVDGGNGGFIKEVALDTAEPYVVADVLMHIRKTQALQVTSGDDA
jgi:hypothetical protein